MPTASLLQDLALVVIVAGCVTVLFHRLKQPVVLGYILAGILLSSGKRQLVGSIDTLSQLGVIFLMFSLGLHFSVRRLATVGITAAIATPLEILLMFGAGYQIGKVLGWGAADAIFLAAIISISSTTIIAKVLAELGQTKERYAQLIFGILIVEDLLAIAIIALLSGITAGGAPSIAGDLLSKMGTLGVFLAMVLVLGLILIPPLLRYLARFRSNELMLVAALGLCFGVSLLAMELGFSVALGAFLVGAIIAESREGGRIQNLIEPLRDMFSAVFFVSIGLMVEPRNLLLNYWPIVVLSLAVILGKTLTCGFGAFVAGQGLRTSLRVGLGLSQIGEFSFVIAQLGVQSGRMPPALYTIAVGVSIVTTSLTPYLIRSSDTLAAGMERLAPRPLRLYLDLYTRWFASLRENRRDTDQIRKLLRKWMLQLGINLLLMTGLFVAAATLARQAHLWWPTALRGLGRPNPILWLAAAVLALPLLIATMRKLRAMAMVLAEMSITRVAAGEMTPLIRAILANTILLCGMLAIGLWILLLSSAILPTGKLLLVMLALVTLIGLLMWGAFVKVYARAQVALRETLTYPTVSAAPDLNRSFSSLLRDAQLEAIVIHPSSPAAGRLIRELQLRSATGASAVGIERDGQSIINPGPDEELQADDHVLLLGSQPQLAAARQLLLGKTSA